MSKITGTCLAYFCKSKLNTPYVYGTKGEVLTKTKLDALTKSYPSIFTKSYKKQAEKYIGKICTDCSGLIGWYTGKYLSSSGLFSAAIERYPIAELHSAPIGAILWKPGHVGVYVGDGRCIEAKGIKYGTVQSNALNRGFTHILILPFIDYGNGLSLLHSKDNWVKDLQAAINRTNKNARLVEDGISGPKTLRACPVLKSGAKGIIVKILQTRLANLGYYKFKPTSKYGKGTVAAVKRFQKAKGLKVDGIVGINTWKALLGL